MEMQEVVDRLGRVEARLREVEAALADKEGGRRGRPALDPAEREARRKGVLARYHASDKGRDARARASQAQAERAKERRAAEGRIRAAKGLAAERRRAARLVEIGQFNDMTPAELRGYLEEVRRVNPALLEALRERGIG
jgi:hypothetical protein